MTFLTSRAFLRAFVPLVVLALFAPASAYAAGHAPVTLPSGLDLTRATIPISIQGEPFTCVLDTGTSAMFVSQAVALELGLPFEAPIDEVAPDGLHYADHHTHLGGVSVGGYALATMPALISSKLQGRNVLCGYDFFTQVPTLIDRDRQQVTIFPGVAALDRMHCLPVDLRPHVPLATINLNGTRVEQVVLDSGMVGGGAVWNGVAGRLAVSPTGMACGQNSTIGFFSGGPSNPLQLCTSSQRPDGYNGIVETNLPSVHQLAVDYPDRRVCFS
jgi:hypothetical protein